MLVYHGSYKKITEIDLSLCRPRTDFGQGFYVTAIKEQAEFWAIRQGRNHKTEGVITEFEFYPNLIQEKKLEYKKFDGYNEEWLDFVVNNRSLQTAMPAHHFDIAEGPVADDDVANRIDDYLAELVDKDVFLKELSYHKPTHQICFCTVRSLQLLIPAAEIKKRLMQIKNEAQREIKKLMESGMNEKDAVDYFYTELFIP